MNAKKQQREGCKMNIGILGAGNIAVAMAKTLNGMEGVTCYAVASRSIEKASTFAKEHGFVKAYGSYLEMVQDDEVELVYIATPHSHHYEHARLCIEHGKPVLCEKAFTINAEESIALFKLAEEKKVFITEAIWTRYMPSRKLIDEVIKSNLIGNVATLTANLGYPIEKVERITEPSLAGGALLDLGVYPINFALMAFGTDIERIDSSAILSEKGVDLQNSMTITYKDGKMAVLNSSAKVAISRQGVIAGDKGYMIVENINNCEAINVYNTQHELIKQIEIPAQITGYEYEVAASIKAIKEGKLECEEMPHEETIRVMRIMDELRKAWGVVYPQECQ